MQIIILAAGKGSRMSSELPKVMHEVGGVPMLERVIRNCYQVTKDIVLVYSRHIESYLHLFSDRCQLVNQEEQLGTAHAVYVAKALFKKDHDIGIIYADNPLITENIINGLFEHLHKTNSKVVTLAFDCYESNHYGRIIIDQNGNLKKIVESKYATEDELKINLCNSGIMAFAPGILEKYIDQCIEPDPIHKEQELYLTKIIEICSRDGEKVSYYKSKDHQLVMGVNNQKELIAANLIADNVNSREG